MSANTINIPNTQFLDATGRVSREWLLWLINPNVATLTTADPIGPAAGGTGLGATPGSGQLLVGNGTNYSLATTLPTNREV